MGFKSNKRPALRGAALVLAVLLAAAFAPPAAPEGRNTADESGGQIRWTPVSGSGETLISEKNGRALYCSPDTGRFHVRDLKSGAVWRAVPDNLDDVEGMKGSEKSKVQSYLLLDVIDPRIRNTVISLSSQSDSVYSDGQVIEQADGILRYTYTFPDYGITVPLCVRLTDSGFEARVDVGAVRETDSFLIRTIAVLPFFDAGYLEEEGFVFVPDGSGAVIRFDNGSSGSQNYDQAVYGYDYGISRYSYTGHEQEVRLPVFGIARTGRFSLGIITEGAGGARLVAGSNTERNFYNYAYPLFTLRSKDVLVYENEQRSDIDIFQKTPLPARTLAVAYRLESTAAPTTAVDMARSYRAYLKDKYGLAERGAMKTQPIYIDLTGATVRIKSLIGVPAQRPETLTTFAQAGRILDALWEAGARNVIIRYRKWSDASVWGKMMGSHTPLSRLGGKRGLDALKKKAENYGYQLFLDADPILVSKGKNPLSFFSDYAQNIRNYTMGLHDYKYSTGVADPESKTRYLVRRDLLGSQLERTDASVARWDTDGLSLSGLSRLYTDFRKPDSFQDETRETLQEALAGLDQNKAYMLENGNEYMLSRASHIVNAPAASSGFDIEDACVPFYQAALHGLLDFANEPVNADPDAVLAFLRAIETGASLRFSFIGETADHLAGSEDEPLYYAYFGRWRATLQKMVKASADYYRRIAGASVLKHERLADGVYRTVYDNGLHAVVNYSKNPAATVYGTVPGEWFLFGAI